jgi:dTDP-4-dehydrorhamnose 3,5-epimerase
MEVRATRLPGVLLLKPKRFIDSRGYFVETYNERDFRAAGVAPVFIQDNQSLSFERGTIRGLHFQLPPAQQAKLVRVLVGGIFDVVIDLRVGSPTYGEWIGQELSAEGGEQVFIPGGLAHGFCTLEPRTEVGYKVDRPYAPDRASGIVWNDPTLRIAWPVPDYEATISEKDRRLSPLSVFKSPFTYPESSDD